MNDTYISESRLMQHCFAALQDQNIRSVVLMGAIVSANLQFSKKVYNIHEAKLTSWKPKNVSVTLWRF